MSQIRIGIAGLGAIGKAVALALVEGMPGLRLTAVAARDQDRARVWLAARDIEATVVPLTDFPKLAISLSNARRASFYQKSAHRC